MKRILTSLLMVCIAATVYAQNGTDQYVDFQIVAQDDIGTPIYRAPALIPVQGYYVSLLNTLYLAFTYDLGNVIVRIENITTGEYSLEIIPTSPGMQTILFNSGAGQYSITIITSGGQQYFSELQI